MAANGTSRNRRSTRHKTRTYSRNFPIQTIRVKRSKISEYPFWTQKLKSWGKLEIIDDTPETKKHIQDKLIIGYGNKNLKQLEDNGIDRVGDLLQVRQPKNRI